VSTFYCRGTLLLLALHNEEQIPTFTEERKYKPIYNRPKTVIKHHVTCMSAWRHVQRTDGRGCMPLKPVDLLLCTQRPFRFIYRPINQSI